MNKISRFSLVVALVTVVTVTCHGQADIYVENGQLIASTGGPANGLFIGGLDITSLCNETADPIGGNYCTGFNFGADGELFQTVLGYSGVSPDGQNQWLFTNLNSFSGVDVVDGILADDANATPEGLSVNSLIGMPWLITLSPDQGGTELMGTVRVVPEPSSALLSLLGLALVVMRRR